MVISEPPLASWLQCRYPKVHLDMNVTKTKFQTFPTRNSRDMADQKYRSVFKNGPCTTTHERGLFSFFHEISQRGQRSSYLCMQIWCESLSLALWRLLTFDIWDAASVGDFALAAAAKDSPIKSSVAWKSIRSSCRGLLSLALYSLAWEDDKSLL